ncbi:unnamed protein product [Hyaloperonospora brassicae]|uniref:RxLR effector candidate protein n=1 Tax=Hyaloperonospora brassicae TaxID=162125 RepID=A0AAV0TLD5_HYABA|nr:unnamed protein product [Hyaloperonospora brassicae]
MKLIHLFGLLVSASVFVGADIAWASDASPEKLNFESTEDPKSHGRGRLRGPAEERMASLEPLAEGTARIVGKVLPKIESIGAKTVPKKAGHITVRARSGEHVLDLKTVAARLDWLILRNTAVERLALNILNETKEKLQRLSLDARVREAKAGERDIESQMELLTIRLLAKLSEPRT